ncbi:MAG TPA: sensor histidine kinase [Vineibacter sp.]|nr:sensor histidine kinase [Vineibacter sp.]
MGPGVRYKVFLLVAGALTLAMVAVVLLVGDNIPAAAMVALAWLVSLAASWQAIGSWLQVDGRSGWSAARTAPLASRMDAAQAEHRLGEIHHRVKGNLQLISSLLNLQTNRIRSRRIRGIFAAAQNRVLTISVLHSHLYEHSNWVEVDFQAFLNDLIRRLSTDHVAPDARKARFYVNAPGVAVSADTAIPVGLIVSEAVSNALRHAFADTTDPQILIRARNVGGTFELSIDDNGVGVASITGGEIDREGLGLTLLHGLTAQLEGKVSICRRPAGGTRVQLSFPIRGHSVVV